jgi:2-amino-4-hydroxy-6-hydroxymethyldihydropteridine diphosphokinase
MVEVFLSLGSNVEREIHIPQALKELQDLFGRLVVSSIYESAAVGFDGDPFHNLVVKFCSDLPVLEIARLLREIEFKHGRSKASKKFESRALDIDLILFGEQIIEQGRIKLPRDEIIHCAFVLEPLAEIAPRLKHPVLGIEFARLWQEFDKSQLHQKRL